MLYIVTQIIQLKERTDGRPNPNDDIVVRLITGKCEALTAEEAIAKFIIHNTSIIQDENTWSFCETVAYTLESITQIK